MAPRSLTLVWAAPALDALDEIAGFIALDNPDAAAALVMRCIDAIERLRNHPASGRRVPEVGGKTYREIIEPPCRIIYRREGARVLIVHVVRSERLLRLEHLP